MLTQDHRALPIGAVLAIVLLVLVQQFAVVPGNGRVAAGLHNAAHGPWFAVVTYLFYRIVSPRLTIGVALGATMAIAVVVALATEAVQLTTGRNAEWSDVAFDLLGACAALTIAAGRAGLLKASAAAVSAATLLAVSISPAIVALGIQAHRNAIFPALVDVGVPWQGGLLRSNGESRRIAPPPDWPQARVLEVELAGVDWPGVSLWEPVADWSAYDALAIDVYARQPMTMHVSIRLADAEVDHVYRTFVLAAGPHRLTLPLEPMFDPQATTVTALVIYSTRAYAGGVFLLGDVRLVRD